eukprot:scaffold1033_cov408-Prasinococcus_capsulatus_cf.AAC.13
MSTLHLPAADVAPEAVAPDAGLGPTEGPHVRARLRNLRRFPNTHRQTLPLNKDRVNEENVRVRGFPPANRRPSCAARRRGQLGPRWDGRALDVPPWPRTGPPLMRAGRGSGRPARPGPERGSGAARRRATFKNAPRQLSNGGRMTLDG